MSVKNGVTVQPEGPFSSIPVRAQPVSPSDSVTFPDATRSLYVGNGGDLTVCLQFDPSTQVTFPNVPSGSTLIAAVVKVMASGTAASGIVALF